MLAGVHTRGKSNTKMTQRKTRDPGPTTHGQLEYQTPIPDGKTISDVFQTKSEALFGNKSQQELEAIKSEFLMLIMIRLDHILHSKRI